MANILIIDDDNDFIRATQFVLEKHNHHVISANSGSAGYACAKSERPDLIVLDVMMDTVLDGISTSQRLHDDPELQQIPIIMVTSIANTDYAELFPTDEYIHINAFMSKPIKPEDLIRQVNRYLAKN
jgi:CheY-like chemotaxis protein